MTARLKAGKKMDPERQKALTAELKNREWYGWCRVCKAQVNGRIAELTNGCPHCGTGMTK